MDHGDRGLCGVEMVEIMVAIIMSSQWFKNPLSPPNPLFFYLKFAAMPPFEGNRDGLWQEFRFFESVPRRAREVSLDFKEHSLE